jgi:hypothetical protein
VSHLSDADAIDIEDYLLGVAGLPKELVSQLLFTPSETTTIFRNSI